MPVAEADQTQSDADLAKQYGGVVEAPQYNLTISDADLAKQYGGTVGAAPTAPQDMLEAVSQKFGGGKAFKDQTPETQQELLKIGNLMVSQGKSAGDVGGMVPPGTPAYQVTPGTPATPPPQEPTTALGEVKNFGKQVGSQLFQAYGNAAHVSANIYGLLDAAAEKISELTGYEKGGFFKSIEDYGREQQRAAEKEATELAGGRQDLPSNITRAVSGMVFNLPTYAAAIAAGGPIGGMTMLGALETADQGWKNELQGALEGALQGGLMHVIGPGGRIIRFTVPMLTTYKALRDQGADFETAASNALAIGGITAFPGGGTGVGQMIRNVPQLPGQIAQSIIPERFKITPQLNTLEQASQQYLTEHDIATPLSMQTGSPAAQQLEASTGRSPGGGAFGRQLEESKQRLVRVGQEQELPRIHPEPVTEEEAGAAVGGKLARDLEQTRSNLLQEVHDSPTTPEAAGQSVIDKGQQIIQQFNQQANDAYDTAWQRAGDPRLTKQVPVARDSTGGLVMGDVNMPVDIRWLKDIAREELPNLELLPAATQAQKAAVSIYRAALANKDYVPAKWAENALSGLKEEAREAPSPQERSYSQGVAAGVIPKLQAGIDAAVAEAGPEALAGLRAGRAATAQKYGVSDLFRKFGRDINDLEPVQVFNGMTWGRDTGIDRLRAISQIAPEEMPAVGRAFIEGGGNWSELGPETKKILFHGDQNLISDLDQYHADLARFGPLTKLEPVALFDRLTRPEARTINQLRAVAKQAPEEMPKLGRAFVQGLLERATREGDLGKVQSILNKWLDLDAQSKGIMFEDPALVHDLDKFFFSLKRMMANPNPSGSGFMMGLNQLKGRLMTGAGLTGAGIFTGNLPSFLGGLGVLGSAGLEVASNAWLARKLFDPRFIRLITKGIDMQNRGNLAGSRLVAGQVLKDFPPEEPPEGPPTGGGAPPNPPEAPAGSEGSAPTSSSKIPDLNELINARNTFYHATSPQTLEGILDSGEIRPSARGGVSVSRVPQGAKAEKGITLVIDANHPDMPRSQPFTEPTYRKTEAGMVRVSPTEWKEIPGGPMNPRFEFENRTLNQSIPLSAVKGVLIDRSTLPEGYDVDGLVKTLADHGIPAEIKESGREIHSVRATAGLGSLQERLQTIGDEAFDRVRKSGTFQGRTLPSMFPAEVTKDMATWGAARIANGAIDFAKWSKAMLNDAADISPEAVAKVRGMLPQLYTDSKKEYEHHLQTMGAGNIADLPTIMKYYRAGKEGKNWYNFVRPALQPLFGDNTDLFLKMFAATSPNTKVTQNVLNAVKAYRQFLLGEPFTGMQAHVDNLNRAVADVKMSGPKVGAFAPNLLGDLNPVTVDLWMARAILGRDTVTPLQSKLVDYMTSQAAKKAGLQPAEMQAAIWTGIKKLQGSRDTSAPPEVVINQYLDRNPDIRKLFEESMQMSKEHFAGLQSKQAPAKPPRN